MLKLVLAVCSTLGASFGGEVPRECVTVYRAFQDAAVPQENDWMDYYKYVGGTPGRIGNSTGSRIYFAPFPYPTMTWCVPNSALLGAPPLTYPFPPFPEYPDYTPSTPTAPLPPGPNR